MSHFLLRKWYLDFVDPRGAAGYLYFVAIGWRSMTIAGVAATILPDPVTPPRTFSRWMRLKHLPRVGDLKVFGACTLADQQSNATVLMRFDGGSVELHYDTPRPAWVPPGGGQLCGSASQSLVWLVTRPDAAVSGRIILGDVTLEINGRGYQDFIETDLPPWRLPLSQLRWGRAHCGRYTVVFDKVGMRDGSERRFLLLDSRGERRVLRCDHLDIAPGAGNATILTNGILKLHLEHPRTIRNGPSVDSSRARPCMLSSILQRAVGAPSEHKMLTSARLEIDGQTHAGTAIHEQVVWNWRQR
jgi:hypothetical protein